jgi:hypothetical protein
MTKTDSLTPIQPNAVNPEGQCSTMAGTTGVFTPKGAEMHSTVRTQVDPCSSMGMTGKPQK